MPAPAGQITFDDFMKVDVRVGQVLAVDPFPEARKPAWKLTIDFGPDIGVKKSSAQITVHYSRDQLLGGQLDQLVLDELGLAVDLGYLCAAEVTATLERRPSHVDVILTGPAMPAALMAMADQVTQLRRGF
jgi:ATP:corrinoid adenosyltransferase